MYIQRMFSSFCFRKKKADDPLPSPVEINEGVIPDNATGESSSGRLESMEIYEQVLKGKYGDARDWIRHASRSEIDIVKNARTSVTGRQVLHMCVKVGGEGVDRLIEACVTAGMEIDCTDYQGHTPLSLACLFDKAPLVELLIRLGAQCSVRLKSGESPLHLACYAGSRSIVELLVRHGASVDVVDNCGVGLLHFCATVNQAFLIAPLARLGCNVNACNNQWRTPLMVAASCSNSRLECLKQLLELDASVDDTDCDGMNAFSLAARKKYFQLDVCLALAKKGIDIHAPGNDGLSGMDILRQKDVSESEIAQIEDAWQQSEKPTARYFLK